MIRVNIDALSRKGGSYFRGPELFDGIGVQVSGPQVVAVYLIEQGKLSTKLNSVIFPGIEASGIIDDFLEEHEEHYNGEPFSFNDQPYTGLAYEFRAQHCICEELYLDGCLKGAITWYLSGKIASYEISDEDVAQDIAWFENGKPKFVKYLGGDVFQMDFRFNENGLTTSLSIYGDYFSRLAVLKEKLKLNHFNMGYIQHEISADESISMLGDGVNDDIFRLVVEEDGLSRTKKLSLFNTSITEVSINLLSKLNNLNQVVVERHRNSCLEDALIRLKKENSSLAIEFNGRAIRL